MEDIDLSSPNTASGSGEERPRWPARYGIGALVAALGTTIIAGGYAVGPVIAVSEGTGLESDPIAFLMSMFTLDAIFVLSAIGFASVAQPLKWSLFGLRKVRIKKALKWIALGVLIYLPIEITVLFLIGKEGGDEHITVLTLIAFAIVAVIFAPISEEFLFRGFIYQAFRNRMGPWLAAILSSLLFGLLHISTFDNYEWVAGPMAALFGVAMCFIFQKTNSIYTTMSWHAVHNGAVVVLVAVGV